MNHKECEHPERRPKDGKCSEEQMRECPNMFFGFLSGVITHYLLLEFFTIE